MSRGPAKQVHKNVQCDVHTVGYVNRFKLW